MPSFSPSKRRVHRDRRLGGGLVIPGLVISGLAIFAVLVVLSRYYISVNISIHYYYFFNRRHSFVKLPICLLDIKFEYANAIVVDGWQLHI